MIEQQRLKVAISEAVDAELSPADGAEQSEVLLGPRAQSTDAFASVSRRSADIACQLTERSRGIHGSQSIQVALDSYPGSNENFVLVKNPDTVLSFES